MPVEVLSSLIRHRRAVVLGALGAVIAATWAYLVLGAGIGNTVGNRLASCTRISVR